MLALLLSSQKLAKNIERGDQMIKGRTLCGRVNLRADPFSGMSDQHRYSAQYGACVLALTTTICIEARLEITSGEPVFNLTKRGRTQEGFRRRIFVGSREARSDDEDFGLVIEIFRRFRLHEARVNLEFSTETFTPEGVGLGTGSAVAYLSAAMANVVTQTGFTNHDLARMTISAEKEALNSWYGWQDQYHPTISGELKFYNWIVGEGLEIEALSLNRSLIQQIESRLVLFFTGISRSAKNVLDRVTTGIRDQDPPVLAALQKMSQCARKARSALLEGDLLAIGPIMNEARAAHLSLHPSVSNDLIDQFITVGLKAGAQGAKICGAGGGGVIAFFAPPDSAHEVKLALNKAGLDTGGQALEFRLTKEPIELWWDDQSASRS